MKIGDYVRTRAGYIGKIININEFREPSMKYGIEFQGADDIIFIGDEHIAKSSSNIIDLIEVGDYVNGHKVIYTAGEKHKLVYVEYVNMSKLLEVKSYQIKSIVTKEQFERMKYEVGD